MNEGALLDSHSLLWLEAGASLELAALEAINQASFMNRLFVSHISIWELGVASNKRRVDRRPGLRGLSAAEWFNETVQRFQLHTLAISAEIAMEASNVPVIGGWG